MKPADEPIPQDALDAATAAYGGHADCPRRQYGSSCGVCSDAIKRIARVMQKYADRLRIPEGATVKIVVPPMQQWEVDVRALAGTDLFARARGSGILSRFV